MNIDQYAETLLHKGELDQKLTSPKVVSSFHQFKLQEIPQLPVRADRIRMSDERVSFPKNLTDINQKAKALHFFANHELLAIEMLAAALLKFQLEETAQKRILATIADEQKHFKLYCDRMRDFGCEFGDYPVNDFFWRQLVKVETFESFYALVALSLEQANLDFAQYYKDVFTRMGDHQTANVLDIVLKDEERHVHFGIDHLITKVEKSEELWDYYQQLLPYNFTPARAKGNMFNEQSRINAGFPEHYIEKIKNYKDDYKIVNRKQWKQE